MQHDASVRLLMTAWSQRAFIFLVLKANDCFTIGDYQLLCLFLEGLHQHSRHECEIAHRCLRRHVESSASFLVWLWYSPHAFAPLFLGSPLFPSQRVIFITFPNEIEIWYQDRNQLGTPRERIVFLRGPNFTSTACMKTTGCPTHFSREGETPLRPLSYGQWRNYGEMENICPRAQHFVGAKLRPECHVVTTKCQMSGDANNYDLQNVECQRLPPGSEISWRSTARVSALMWFAWRSRLAFFTFCFKMT